MRLVILNAGADTAGCGIALKRAFDRYSDWETRAVCRHDTYLHYPTDIVWPENAPLRQTREVVELVRAADVVHVMDHEYALRPFRSVVRGKTIVVHHLGTNFRRAPTAVSAYCQGMGATEVTDSLDLMLFPHIAWLPVPANLETLAAYREGFQPSARIRIAHAPTNRAIKSTELIEATVAELAQRYPIDFDLIERVSNRECLERKAKADIFVDELTLGFGLNAIECWAMGIPVVSGLADPEARRKAFEMWGRLPWADATPATLALTIETLVVSASARARLAEVGREHVSAWHSEEAVVRQTIGVYERAGLRVAA